MDATEYERLKRLERLEAPTFNDHLLAIPSKPNDAVEALVAELRDLDLG